MVVLTLITYFLFQEGFGFFGQNHRSLLTYRQAGLEYVDYIRQQETGHTALNRYLADLRLRSLTSSSRSRNSTSKPPTPDWRRSTISPDTSPTASIRCAE